MQKNKSTHSKFNFVDLILVVLCLCGIFFCFVLFYNDINISLKTDGPHIAVIYFKKNTAQRRLIDRNLWERLQQASYVYNGDRVRTAAQSEAVVVFGDKTQINIHENTLIQLYQDDEKVAVDFVNGSISAVVAPVETVNVSNKKASKPQSSLVITASGKAIEFSGGTKADLAVQTPTKAIPLQTESTDESIATELAEESAAESPLLIAVTEGNVEVREEKIDDIPVIMPAETNSVVSILRSSVDSIVKTSQITREVAKSEEKQNTTKSNSTNIETDKETPIVKKISSGESVIIKTEEVKTPTKQQNVAQKAEEKPIVEVPSLNVFVPSKSTTVLRSDKEPEKATFMWESNKSVVIEFSNESSFKEILKSISYDKETINTSVELPKTKENTLYWRMLTSYDEMSVNPVSVNGFITFQEPPKESVEELIASSFVPKEKQKAEKSEAKVVEKPVEQPKVVEDVVVNTNSEPKADEIETKESETVTEQTEIVSKSEKKPEIAKTVEEVPVVEENKVAPILSLQASLIGPANNTVFNETFFETATEIKFEWSSVKYAKSYSFNITHAGKNVLTRQLPSNSYLFSGDDFNILDVGEFTWSVKAVDKDGKESKVSSSKFIIDLGDLGEAVIDTTTLIDR